MSEIKTTIITKQTGSGHYKVSLIQNHECIGEFETTDMQLIDDIDEIDNGFERELIMHDNFNEVLNTCIERAGL